MLALTIGTIVAGANIVGKGQCELFFSCPKLIVTPCVQTGSFRLAGKVPLGIGRCSPAIPSCGRSPDFFPVKPTWPCWVRGRNSDLGLVKHIAQLLLSGMCALREMCLARWPNAKPVRTSKITSHYVAQWLRLILAGRDAWSIFWTTMGPVNISPSARKRRSSDRVTCSWQHFDRG